MPLKASLALGTVIEPVLLYSVYLTNATGKGSMVRNCSPAHTMCMLLSGEILAYEGDLYGNMLVELLVFLILLILTVWKP